MQQAPKNGLGERVPFAFSAQGRIRPEEMLRRKIMLKMIARREGRLAHAAAPLVRRAT